MRWILHNNRERDAVCANIQKIDVDPRKPYEVECRKKTKRRTLPLNSTYWLWLTAISVETGNDKDDLHDFFSNRYLPKRTIILFDKEHTKRWSTTELDNLAFIEYMERIQRDMAEYGIQLEWPSSPLFEQFHSHYKGKVG